MSDYIIEFSDETGEHRSDDQINEMVEKMRTVANEYSFDLSSYGNRNALRKRSVSETMDLLKETLIERINNEGV